MRKQSITSLIVLMIFLIILSVSIAGCVSSQSVQSTSTRQVDNNPTTSTNSKTCIGDCKIGQSATDGYYNHQQFTLNHVIFLKQPYIDTDPNLGKEWHNWDWLVLNISLKNLRPEKSIEQGIMELKDANGKSITCFEHLPLELTTFNFDEFKAGETKTGNIPCVLSPEAKLPLKFEYGFDNWFEENNGHGTHATHISNPSDN